MGQAKIEEVKLLAIDPGSKNLGWAHMIEDRVLMAGTQKLWGNVPKTFTTLWYFIRLHLEGIRHESGYRIVPRYLIIESFFPMRRKGATVIPQLSGVIKLAAYQMITVKVIEVAPGTVKKFVTGNGRATKDEVRAVINNMYDMGITSTDEADAIGIGLAGLDKIRRQGNQE